MPTKKPSKPTPGAKPKAKAKGATPKAGGRDHAADEFCPCLTGFYSLVQRRVLSPAETRAAQRDGSIPGGAVVAGFSPNGISFSPPGTFGAVFQSSAAWNTAMGEGVTLKVHYVDTPADRIRKKVEEYARGWSEVCGLKFEFGAGFNESQIRIKFKAPGFRSLVGTEGLRSPDPDTMWLGFKGDESDRAIKRLVLHEFGHAIGLCHEHQHPESGIEWNMPEAIRVLAGGLPPGTPEPVIRAQIELGPANGRRFKIEPFDPDSIMLYRISRAMVSGHFDPAWDKDNFELSTSDKRIAQMIYGPPDGPPPPIEPKELKVDGPPVADSITEDVDVDLFFFDAPRMGRYTITVTGDAQVHVDITDKDGKKLDPDDRGEDTFSNSSGMTMIRICDEGRHNLRLTGSKHAQGFSKGSYMIQVKLKPKS